MSLREYNFDGLVGPTHNYGGLSAGNLASQTHGGQVSNPREAARQGLAKMRFVRGLGVGQAVLPPHLRPSLRMLRRLGFTGTDEQVLARVAREDPLLLRQCSSASPMWTANAATVAPGEDTSDGRLHLTPANLQQMFHRSLEADTTYAVLKEIFGDRRRFSVHEPLPSVGAFADEGAANHTRLQTDAQRAVHVFAWGRTTTRAVPQPKRYPARQTLEASRALSRLHGLDPTRCVFPQQAPAGIDAGAFHTDVLAVGSGPLLLLHESAFIDPEGVLGELRRLLGDGFRWVLATEQELPATEAVAAYPFNSQLLTRPDGSMCIVAPAECRDTPSAHAYLERVVAEANPVTEVHYLDVRQSMHNGGGPACLRLRVPMSDEDVRAVHARVFLDDALDQELLAWVDRHYRDRLEPDDLADPQLARESLTALDELTRILQLGNVYEFQH